MNINLNPNKKVGKIPVLLLLLQLVIILFSVGNFLVHKGSLYSHTYTVDDYRLAAGELTEDMAVIDDTSGFHGSFLSVPAALAKGSYQIQLQYVSTASGNRLSASGQNISNLHFLSNAADLSTASNHALMYLELGAACQDVELQVSYAGAGTLEIYSISIYETTAFYKRQMVYALGICLLLSLGYCFFKAPVSKRKIGFALTMIFAASGIPLFLDYMIVGHDLPFHLLRIEGIQYSLRQGVFPVKIDPVWAQDYGYAVSVFYGNTLLYFPALLRILGFTVQSAYKTFVLAVNLGTVLLSYYSFKTMFRSEKAGIWGSLLYTLSIYRLSDVYVRAAVGEFSALMFLPLVLCGFYLAFTAAKEDTRSQRRSVILLALGLSGVIQTHVLTCEMIAVLVIITCIVLIKKVLRGYTFRTLAAAALSTLLLNLHFLIPFLDFYNADINIRSEEWGSGAFDLIQGKGMFPAQLLSLLPKYTGGNWDTINGIANEATYAPGIVLILFALLFLYLIFCGTQENCSISVKAALTSAKDRLLMPAALCCVLGLLSLWMSSCYFPYDMLSGIHSSVAAVISSLQFPWRFLAPATVLLVFVAVYTIGRIYPAAVYQESKTDTPSPRTDIEGYRSTLLPALLLLFSINVGWFFYDYMYSGSPYRVYETQELDSMAMYSYEYLPTGTDPALISAGRLVTDGCIISDYTKEGTTICATVSTDTSGGYVEFPLNYYKYYACKDVATGDSLSTDAGYNNMVRVTLPAGYNGSIQVYFREPLHWRIAEILSLLSLLALLFIYKTHKKRL